MFAKNINYLTITFLYVGSIEERKNLLTLTQKYERVTRTTASGDWHGKQYKKQCLKFVEDNNLNQRIHFLSGLSLNEMAAIYQSAEMMIYPSILKVLAYQSWKHYFAKYQSSPPKVDALVKVEGLTLTILTH